MTLDIRWDLLGAPADVGGAVMAGFQYGREQRQQMAQQSAFAALAKNPDDPEAQARVAALGPDGTRFAFAVQDRQRKQRLQEALGSVFSRGSGTPAPSAFGSVPEAPAVPPVSDASPMAAADPAAAPAAMAASPALSLTAPTIAQRGPSFTREDFARIAAIDFDAAQEAQKTFAAMDKVTQEQWANKYKAATPALLQMLNMPAAERASFFQQIAPGLLQAGFTQQELAGFDPTNDRQVLAHAVFGMTAEQSMDYGKVDWQAVPEGGRLIPLDQRGRRLDVVGSEASAPVIVPNTDMPRPQSKAERDALPPGAEYIAPDGRVMRKGGAAPATGPANFP